MMITAKEYYILTFETTTDTMYAAKYLEPYFSIAVMPLPQEISSGCGLAIRFRESSESEILSFLTHTPLNAALYKMYTKKKPENIRYKNCFRQGKGAAAIRKCSSPFFADSLCNSLCFKPQIL